jgi:hypothetical protein
MQLQSNPMTIATYLEHYGYAVIRSEGEHKLVQLKNLKLVQIESRRDCSYIIQEVTLGQAGERWEDISIETVIEHMQMLEGGQDVYSKIWHLVVQKTPEVITLSRVREERGESVGN